MWASRRSALGPQVVAIALIGLGVTGCSDSDRFVNPFASENPSRNEVTGSVPPGGSGRIESRPMPRPSGNSGEGTSGGGRGMGSYQLGNSDITGTVTPAAQPPKWTWEGGKPIVVAPGENLEAISRRYGVPVAAIIEANGLTSPATVHPGQHLVIPRHRGPSPAAAVSSPPTRIASNTPTVPSAAPVGPPRSALAPASSVHIVAPGETLHSIARHYGKPVLVLAKANNIPPDTMVRIGERIVIPDVRPTAASAASPARAEAPPAPAAGPALASAESPHSARLASPAAQPAAQSAVKSAEPAGGLPGFRWPVRGRIIAGFGPKPNGLQNDGINLAVPEGTPVKAADDGVVAYAGNELKGYGNLVLVRHGNGFVTAYAHASEIMVKRGDEVKRGQVIAKSGQTGSVTAPQLHFEIRKGSTPVDPAQYLSGA
jgi:murein DD-endopeptidase MepM/ murein hydrolase activator NlpD